MKAWLRRKIRGFLESQEELRCSIRFCDPSAHLDTGVYISSPEYVTLGKNVALYRETKIFCGPGDSSWAMIHIWQAMSM